MCKKHESLGQLRTPTDSQLSGWATKSHIVHKKDDAHGRWIMDFRPLNQATVSVPIVIGDCGEKARSLSRRRLKSVFDLYAGFNQIEATERAARAMTILTSLGLRQWLVMPFGVRNGPAFFQLAMQRIFGDMLGDQMQQLRATLEYFMDDGALGTGDALESNPCRATDFAEHLIALDKILERAIQH